jgi:hypothetical protein
MTDVSVCQTEGFQAVWLSFAFYCFAKCLLFIKLLMQEVAISILTRSSIFI